jgi:dihydroxy-acid dehydratase
MARRAGIDLKLERFDEISRKVPVLANIRPSGVFLMEDFYYAGGLRALMNEVKDLLNLECTTVSGKTVGENIEGAEIHDDDVIRRFANPISDKGSTAVLKGNLAPEGAVIKASAAEQQLHRHTGPAIVFKDYNDMAAHIDDPDLPITKDSGQVCPSGVSFPFPRSCFKRA